MAVSALEQVLARLRGYAERGIFSGFDSRSLPGGRLELRFRWHGDRPHRLRVDPVRRTLVLVDLLPEIAYRSPMDGALRAFLAARASPELPEHRRLDPRRATVRAINRRGAVSVEVKAAKGQLPYAAERTVKLLNEVFLSFLAGPYEAYMVRVFGVPEE